MFWNREAGPTASLWSLPQSAQENSHRLRLPCWLAAWLSGGLAAWYADELASCLENLEGSLQLLVHLAPSITSIDISIRIAVLLEMKASSAARKEERLVQEGLSGIGGFLHDSQNKHK